MKMKHKMIGLLLAGTMAVSIMTSSLAMAGNVHSIESEQSVSTQGTYSVDIENGIMTIRIDSNSENDQYQWQFEGEDTENSSIELLTDSTQEGHSYVGSFKAVDGCKNKEGNLRLIHTNGFCTDQYMDFRFMIEDGKITTLTGGTTTPPTPASDLAKVLEGTWQERSEGITMLDIAPGKNGGLDMVMSDGSGRDGKTSFYTMTAYYDAVMRALVYNNGTFHEGVAITDGSQEQTESDTQQGSGIGTMEAIFSEDGASVEQINWTNQDGGAVVFVRTPEL